MSAPVALSTQLTAEYINAFTIVDQLFGALSDEAMYMRPIAWRNPCIFYLGHLPAFAWNQIFRHALKRPSFDSRFDSLFERGIDPADPALSEVNPADWPDVASVLQYKHQIERELFGLLGCAEFNYPDSRDRLLTALNVVLEHYLMHIETFLYMMHQLPLGSLRRLAIGSQAGTTDSAYGASAHFVTIPPGKVTLGADRGELPFGWCNEFGKETTVIDSFAMSTLPVTNGEFAEFVESGGYDDEQWWSPEGWRWVKQFNRHQPQFWMREGDGWVYRNLLSIAPLVEDAPAYVSKAEAEAYARFKGAALPTESQFHRAAFGTEAEEERSYPWGDNEPEPKHGNFGLNQLEPKPVGSTPAGASFFGIQELIGNGWEWTSTPFAPFAGFRPMPAYPGYSADFFDGKHFVMKGASPVTGTRLVRRTFRNWFRGEYPYVYAKFRLVQADYGRAA